MSRREDVDVDATAVRRASRIVGVQLTIASGALVVAAIGLAFFWVLDQLRPAEVNEKPLPGEHKIYIDTVNAMIAFIVIGVLAVVVAGALSVVVTRRAVRPLGRALRIQRAFVQDASHELRTPLAVLDARLQVLQRGLPPGDPSAPLVGELRADARTLIDVVDDLLIAADPQEVAPDGEPVRVGPAVARAVDGMRVLASDDGVHLELVADEDAATLVPGTSIQRCATALLDNALAHSPRGSTVTARVAREGRDVLLSVADQGAGIRGIDPARIFDRFARAPRPAGTAGSRSGFGIGLALVREVAVRFGGEVGVTSTGPAGTTLTVRLPAA